MRVKKCCDRSMEMMEKEYYYIKDGKVDLAGPETFYDADVIKDVSYCPLCGKKLELEE